MKIKAVFLSLVLAAAAVFVPSARAQGGFVTFNQNFNPAAQALTATSQTTATINIAGYSYATFEVYGTAITTITLGLQGSNDGGVHWYALNSAVVTAPGTVATTQTATANTLYIANVAGMTNLRFVTSSTFTATGAFVKLIATVSRGLL